MLRLLSFACSAGLEEEDEEHCNLVNSTSANIAHIVYKIFIGVNFNGDLHLDVKN